MYFNIILLLLIIKQVSAFWDTGTTTSAPHNYETVPRQSFFRWQRIEFEYLRFWFPWWDWQELTYRRCLNVVAGISIDFIPLSTALILNRRTLITAANYLEPYMDRQRDLRIWALGRAGSHITPYRYRVWRARRIFPRSMNPEHSHGPRGSHVPRHDIVIIHSLDQMYIYSYQPTRYHYAYRTFLATKHQKLQSVVWYVGSGYWDLEHIYQNYKIWYSKAKRSDVIDCSIVLPKWWGKFICIKNIYGHKGLQNGGGFFSGFYLVGIGCFEIRYNEYKYLVFTDLRYYMDYIYKIAHMSAGEYYEYAYPQWGVALSTVFDGYSNNPYIPTWQLRYDLYPLGK